MKNNRDRRNLKAYFENYANDGVIDSQGLRKIVKEYGFDINEDEANLIFKLTHKSNKSEKETNSLNIDGFIELMTKDDVFYKTLQIGQPKVGSEFTFQKTFSEKVHEILRNKFPRLK